MAEYSKDALLRFTEFVREKGLVNSGRAAGWKVAITQVLTELAPNEEADVRSADIDSAFTRFINKNPGSLSPKSLAEYRRRIDAAIREFVEWRTNPTGYKPKGRTSQARTENGDRGGNGRPRVTQQPAIHSPTPEPPKTGLVLPYPIRADFTAQIVVPRDLTVDEAKRLGAFILTLAADFKPQG